jgi:hypothetical protein
VEKYGRRLWLVSGVVLYLVLAAHQLGLPGLHYDESAEAGVNALQLLTSAPVTAFRGATLTLFNHTLPLMVQDYIGALNVYLALPFLALTGIGVPNLRSLAVLIGLAALLLLERALSEWQALRDEDNQKQHKQEALNERQLGLPSLAWPEVHTPISLAGLLAVTLLAASPSFVFWSRQGIFVTNLTQPLSFWCIWQGLRWLRSGRPRALLFCALAGGLALYAKLLALWVIGPFALLMALAWGWRRWRTPTRAPRLTWGLILGVIGVFLASLFPLIFFNWQTGGLVERIMLNLDQSYYGVNHREWWHNATVRWPQLWQVLRGEHLWYLGGVYANPLAVWVTGFALLMGMLRGWRLLTLPLLLLGLAFVCSLFTVSDLFITHQALLQPVAVAVVAIGLACGWADSRQAKHHTGFWRRSVNYWVVGLVLLWLGGDLATTLRYHTALTRSGGVADHSDATYHLAYYLEHHGLGAPIVLDWGMAAPIYYLSRGKVTPIEIFGYASLQQPDAQFGERLRLFLVNEDNVYLLRAPSSTVFAGRREHFMQESAAWGRRLIVEQQFAQRDGIPLFEIWRVVD